jgi:alkanesulfonate monooxygenase SsuD/methylene tetrahydromethanopterin reductase-like flavin-dependent oxidoreductase (luciferase family)
MATEEAAALGMPWDRRGVRTEEHIAVLRTIWNGSDTDASFEGDYFAFAQIDRRPVPERSIPVLIGGHSAIALDRAVRIGDGGLASGMSPERLGATLDPLRAKCVEHDRAFADLWIACSTPIRLDAGGSSAALDVLRHYESLGVNHVSVAVRGDSEQWLRQLRQPPQWSNERTTWSRGTMPLTCGPTASTTPAPS